MPFVDAVRDAQGNIDGFILLDDLRSAVYGKRKKKDRATKYHPDVFRYIFFLKAAVLSIDGSGGDFVIMLIHEPGSRLAFARAGDEAWTPLRTPLAFRDVIPCGGSFYTVSCKATIHSWDVGDDGFIDVRHRADPLKSGGWSFKPRLVAAGKSDGAFWQNLVISPDGRLLLLLRKQWDGVAGNGTLCCELLELHLGKRGKHKWSRVKDMNDDVLFVGNYQSLSISAAECPELRRNCIYFTQNNNEYLKPGVGVYDMMDSSVKPLECRPSHLTWPPSIWFTLLL